MQCRWKNSGLNDSKSFEIIQF